MHNDHYEFIVMPFGITNAQSTFWSFMNYLLRPYLQKLVLVFFDNILVYNCNWANHFCHLQTVLLISSNNQLFVKQSKYYIRVLQVTYLRHFLSFAIMFVDPNKIESVLNWPISTIAQGVHDFLGLVRYYRKFINRFDGIIIPLTQLISKYSFHGLIKQQHLSHNLNKALTSLSVFLLPNFSQQFVIKCDACEVGI